MESIQPLSAPQKRLLQRLLACHVLPDNALQMLWDEIRNTVQQGEAFGRDVKHTIGLINRSLKPAFGLEIRSVVLSLDTNDEMSGETVVYHSVVNCHRDHVSTTFANPALSKNPHEFALLRLIVERLVETFTRTIHDEQENENDEDGDDNQEGSRKRRKRTRRNKGCHASLSRIDMINLRTQLAGAHAGKLEIQHAENAINLFESQGWLVEAAPPTDPNSSSRRTSTGGGRRGASHLQLGARAYMEFPEFLEKAGLDKEHHPQSLLY